MLAEAVGALDARGLLPLGLLLARHPAVHSVQPDRPAAGCAEDCDGVELGTDAEGAGFPLLQPGAQALGVVGVAAEGYGVALVLETDGAGLLRVNLVGETVLDAVVVEVDLSVGVSVLRPGPGCLLRGPVDAYNAAMDHQEQTDQDGDGEDDNDHNSSDAD